MWGPGQVAIRDFAHPEIQKSTDAIIKIVRACVCGSDLWWFRGLSEHPTGSPVGHEAIGVAEKVGAAVTNVKAGDFVILPFTHGCGHCAACRAGFEGNCLNATKHGSNGHHNRQYRISKCGYSVFGHLLCLQLMVNLGLLYHSVDTATTSQKATVGPLTNSRFLTHQSCWRYDRRRLDDDL
ncbi:alcohol dehydrogenase catalytic domain-containing protein [Lacticaseibacillus salsurivasis]|uniref:alcohol dehydrogenase catalytic domain-containing protein n=1 Tax=Lacticaseibacillus salsurivasis TaxID=3081441 RepID=UPI003F4F01B5